MLRVSEVIRYHPPPFLTKWEAKKGWKECERIREEALEIGSEVDWLVRADVNGKTGTEGCGDEVRNCMKAWENFKASPEGGRFFEQAVKNRSNMQKELILDDLIGHPDFIFDDELPDLKTSKSINLSHWMQVAQYAKMRDHHVLLEGIPVPWLKIKTISILRLDKYDERGVWEYKTLGELFITSFQEMFKTRYDHVIGCISRKQDIGKWMYEREEKSFADLMRKKLEVDKLQ